MAKARHAHRKTNGKPKSSKHGFSFGDIVVCDYPHHDGTSKVRPVVIWGEYTTISGNTIYAVVPSTTQISYHPSDLLIKPEMVTKPNGKLHEITLNNIAFVSKQTIHLKQGVASKIKQEFWADMIAKRAQSLIFNPQSDVIIPRPFDALIKANQYTLEPITQNYVISGVVPPDISDGLAQFDAHDCKLIMPKGRISQDDVNAIVKWSILSSKQQMDARKKIAFPPPGTWPNWPDLEHNGQTIRCHADQDEVIVAPKVTASTKPTAAQKRAQKLGAFTLG